MLCKLRQRNDVDKKSTQYDHQPEEGLDQLELDWVWTCWFGDGDHFGYWWLTRWGGKTLWAGIKVSTFPNARRQWFLPCRDPSANIQSSSIALAVAKSMWHTRCPKYLISCHRGLHWHDLPLGFPMRICELALIAGVVASDQSDHFQRGSTRLCIESV